MLAEKGGHNLAAKLLQKGVELGKDDILLGAESGIVGKSSGVEHNATVHIRKHLGKKNTIKQSSHNLLLLARIHVRS